MLDGLGCFGHSEPTAANVSIAQTALKRQRAIGSLRNRKLVSETSDVASVMRRPSSATNVIFF